MRRGRWTGVWLVLVAVFFTQSGLNAETQVAEQVRGPSQGNLPDETSPSPGGGGGGGQASPSPDNIIPVLPGNPGGLDAVPTASPSPTPMNGGGGGGPADGWYGPFIRVLPSGGVEGASPTPSPPERPVVD